MAKFYNEINDELLEFIRRQHIFFVATTAKDCRVNLSPKGMDTLRVLQPNRIAYLDLTGSGNETAAHLHHDGRMTMMFCSFGEHPQILRIYGKGEVIQPADPLWEIRLADFTPLPGQRQIVVLNVESAQTSCGYAVPYFDYTGERETLRRWAEKKGNEGLALYRLEKNHRSIDGLDTGYQCVSPDHTVDK